MDTPQQTDIDPNRSNWIGDGFDVLFNKKTDSVQVTMTPEMTLELRRALWNVYLEATSVYQLAQALDLAMAKREETWT